jgi:hypothetical protein
MTQLEQVIIHVRFAPNGKVTEIGERPAAVEAQDWFNALTVRAGGHYQPLAGGRGVFRLTRDEVSRFQQQAA